ncbi:diguanylate cyclase (GGDEF)-like protein/PAS domain S-box-containing protein [Azospirillum lipoferum]|uniref:EAL domain-containing protein n=1 Tax=Azospirillum lipoferum TaxID=193 RepID=A0A5A9GGE9_AZOLI|nr:MULTISPECIES: EAL domain-containing protein [Azospirillum]KAA0592369.1 EAL domain-containing protein [Azospirillum lipoferum]MCP1614598.1 diguanylate cyclase (GGDEF)-like protein/PAS domain S-box-containing protein [Azospirillum lipoferum]MDW5532571.1 EAL domain-containing protein [Azospirillum sp. NL1]
MHQTLTAEFDWLPDHKLPQTNALYDALPVGIAFLDRQLRCLRLNRRMGALAGIPPTAAAGLPFTDVWPGAEDALLAAAPSALAGTVVEDILLAGSDRLLVATLHPHCGEDGTALLCVVEDRTELRQCKAEVHRVKELHRHTLELSDLYPWCSTPDGTPRTTRRWRERTGLDAAETATAPDWIAALHPDDRAPFEAAWTHSLLNGAELEIDLRLRVAGSGGSGETHRWFRRRSSPQRDEDGRIVQWYGTDEDIHERRLAEDALRESEGFARQILDNSPECVKVLDMEGRLTFMNIPGLHLMELDSFDCVENQLWESFWPEERITQLRETIGIARRGGTGRFLGFCPTAKGTPKWWDNLVCPLPGADGRPQRLLAISRDVTDIQLARQALEETTALLSGVLESTTDSVVFVDRDWRITYRNPAAAAVHEGRGIRLGDDFFDVFPQQTESRSRFRKAMTDQTPAVFEEFVTALDQWTEIHAFPTAQGLSVFFRNVTERRRLEEERRIAQDKIARLARLDSLTGLPNRLYFHERLEQALRDATGDCAMAVHYIDLDQFKAVNDTLGHHAGDALLRQVADRLRGCIGTADLVSRFGGDEFAILQTNLWGPAEAEDLARCITSALAEPFDIDGARIQTGTSVGIALFRRDGDEADALMKAADIALYRAKADGRNTHRFFAPEMAERLKAFHDLKLGLHEALRRGEFELHYQPLVCTGDTRIRGFEALIRWRRPGRGLIGPGDFIPVAEETGLIGPIGDWALREACREATRWPDDIRVSVNVSSVQFRNKGLVESVRQTLADTGLAPGRLELEITESVLLQDDDANLDTLRELRALGTRIVMDDFGTGYSALGYLCRFRFDKVKIDRSFVAHLPRCDGSTAVVQAVAGMGRNLGIVITAEGVEDHTQLDAVRRLGCHEAQGYLFSRPVPAAEVPALIAGG